MSQDALTRAVANAVRDVVASPEVPADPGAIDPIAKAVAPIIQNATNAEPWFQSRVTLGALATMISSGFALYAMLSAGITDGELLGPPVGAILGGALTLYGRWIATRPLGR